MRLVRSLLLSLSMFTKIPMPKVRWEEENMGFVLCFLPVAGVVIGAVLLGWAKLCTFLRMGALIRAVGFTLLPLLFSGGIHMDGFLDTTDALSSHGDVEKKRTILKDSHVGAFGVIGACCYILTMFGFYTEAEVANGAVLLLGLIPVLSRATGALCSLLFPPYGQEGLLTTFRKGANRGWAVALTVVQWVAVGAAMVYVGRIPGIACMIAALLFAVCLYVVAKNQFGGMSGDLAGWYITLSETVMLIALVCGQKAVIL